jgi:hypothetical protein
MQTIPMPPNIQLRIPEPCHQDWHTMLPEEKGRFCSSCSKTVVDFSLMSDKEVLAHLGGAGGHTCGRFTSDQLNRNLMPPPERKMGWPAFWQLALATLLVSARAEAQMGKPKLVVHQTDKQPKPQRQLPALASDEVVLRGPNGLAIPKSTPEAVKARADSAIPKTNQIFSKGEVVTAGMVVVARRTKRTATTRIIDSARSWLADTLAIPALRCRAVTLYPNPAPRGTTIRVVMRALPAGQYSLALYNTAGERIQERAVDLGGKEQVELWNIPSSLPSGIYLVELCAPGLKRIYTGKLMIQ